MATKDYQPTLWKQLTNQQQVFCDEYLIDLNGKQAAIRAGYSPRSAEVQASKLLSKGKVAAYVSICMAARSKRTGITQDRVLEELAKIGFANISDLTDEDGGLNIAANRDDIAAVASYKVKVTKSSYGEDKETETIEKEIKMYDKVNALITMGKHLGTFEKDNRQKENTVIKVTIDYPDDDEEI